MKSCYKLAKTMTKFAKENRHWLSVELKKKWLTQQNVGQQCTHMTCSVHLHRDNMLTVPFDCPITLSY